MHTPCPVKPIDGSSLNEGLDFDVALHVTDVGIYDALPLLVIQILLLPCVRRNRIRWEFTVGHEVMHLPALCADQSHVCSYGLGQKINESGHME